MLNENIEKKISNFALSYLYENLYPVTIEKFNSFLIALIHIDNELNNEFDMKTIIMNNILYFQKTNYSNLNLSSKKNISKYDKYKIQKIKSLEFNLENMEENEYYYEMAKVIVNNFLVGKNSVISSQEELSLFINEIFIWFFENVV